jgi:hypothetical protein
MNLPMRLLAAAAMASATSLAYIRFFRPWQLRFAQGAEQHNAAAWA